MIVEKQKGKSRAKYGDFLIYIVYPIRSSIMSELSWTHYLELLKIKENKKRDFYMKECINSNWNVKELQRQRTTLLYERLVTSKDKSKVLELSRYLSYLI